MRIGWVGLGMIGAEMVKRLLASGFDVSVYDRGAGAAEVKALGASASSDYRALATGSDLFVVCVFDDSQVRDVLLEQGALSAMRSGSIVAVHTTGAPALAKELAVLGERAGVAVIDATFSGGPADIQAGTLTIMVGGDGSALDRAMPAFESYARHIHHVGEAGSGQTMKLLNNLLFATNLMNAANVLDLAAGQGFDTAQVASIIGECSGASYAMARFQSPLPSADLLDRVRPYLEKDVATVFAAGGASGIDLAPFAATAAFFAR